MSEFKGTKGKWTESKHAKGHIASSETGRMIAGCMGYTTNADNGEHIQESLANAKLISKAPELLEMLKGILSDIHSGNYPNGEWKVDEIEQLIKEATII